MMPVAIQWVIEKRAVLISLSGHITGEAIIELNQQSLGWLQEAKLPIHFLVDASRVASNPLNVIKLKQIVNSAADPNTGIWVIINASRLAMYTALLLARLFNVTIFAAHSLEDAIRIVMERDETLPPPPPLSNGEIKRTIP